MALAESGDDVLLALRSGLGIRFGAATVKRGGVLGIQVDLALGLLLEFIEIQLE